MTEKKRRRKVTEKHQSMIVSLYEERVPIREIARRMKRTENVVYGALKRAGVFPRPTKEVPAPAKPVERSLPELVALIRLAVREQLPNAVAAEIDFESDSLEAVCRTRRKVV